MQNVVHTNCVAENNFEWDCCQKVIVCNSRYCQSNLLLADC